MWTETVDRCQLTVVCRRQKNDDKKQYNRENRLGVASDVPSIGSYWRFNGLRCSI